MFEVARKFGHALQNTSGHAWWSCQHARQSWSLVLPAEKMKGKRVPNGVGMVALELGAKLRSGIWNLKAEQENMLVENEAINCLIRI